MLNLSKIRFYKLRHICLKRCLHISTEVTISQKFSMDGRKFTFEKFLKNKVPAYLRKIFFHAIEENFESCLHIR